jgi:hypothetical protein
MCARVCMLVYVYDFKGLWCNFCMHIFFFTHARIHVFLPFVRTYVLDKLVSIYLRLEHVCMHVCVSNVRIHNMRNKLMRML